MTNKKVIFTAALIVAVIAGGIIIWRVDRGEKPAAPVALPITPTVSGGLGSQIYESGKNPIGGKVPDTNPFKVNANPFGSAETNPLRSSYQNPF